MSSPDIFRFRSERTGQRGLGSVLDTRAPRLATSGDAAGQSGGSGGLGSHYGIAPGSTDGDDRGVPEIGDPATGQRVAVWGFFAWGGTTDVFGA